MPPPTIVIPLAPDKHFMSLQMSDAERDVIIGACFDFGGETAEASLAEICKEWLARRAATLDRGAGGCPP